MNISSFPPFVDPSLQASPASMAAAAFPGATPVAANAPMIAIGVVEDVNFNSAVVMFERAALTALRDHPDQSLAISGTIGGQIKISTGGRWLVASVTKMLVDRRATDNDRFRVEVEFLGEGDIGHEGTLTDFQRGVTRYPNPGDAVAPMRKADLLNLFRSRGSAAVEIGTVYPTSSVRASLDVDPMLARHFAILGSTGSGKSTATAMILNRILDIAPHGHIVLIDPHGEYGPAFRRRATIFNVDNLDLPYWLMNFEEHCEVFITSDGPERELDRSVLAKCLTAARAKSHLAKTYIDHTVDAPIPYHFADVLAALDAEMGRLDKSSDTGRYLRLRTRVEEMLRDPRYSFMFNNSLANDSMKPFLARLLRLENDGRPISVFDLSGVPSDIVATVVALVSRIIMDHAVWSRDEDPRPALIVCEEAHRYVPAERFSTGVAARRSLERIAKEGRKYGVSLGLVTQRPSDLAEGALSQCGTIITMRLNNEADQNCVRNALPEGGRGFLQSLPALRMGEAIICGEGVAMPMRVRLDLQPVSERPSSNDPSFSNVWTRERTDREALSRTIHRWRGAEADGSTPAPATSTSALLKPDSLFLKG